MQTAHGTLVIRSYNDFILEGGKIWTRKGVAEANKCVNESVRHRDSMLRVVRPAVCTITEKWLSVELWIGVYPTR